MRVPGPDDRIVLDDPPLSLEGDILVFPEVRVGHATIESMRV